MKKSLAGFSLIMIMFFNFVYIYDLRSSNNKLLENVSINNLRGQEFQSSEESPQNSDSYVENKINDIPSGWNYQKLVIISPATEQSNYQVKVVLTEENFDYTQALSDGSDIRFQDLSNNPLSYWIESWNMNSESIIWVKIPTIGTDRFYLNHGNPSAISESNGDSTFLFFDDFSGESVNPSKWTTINGLSSSTTVSDNIVSLAIDHPDDFGSGLIAGFTDFQINQGTSGAGYATFENTVSIGQIWGGSHYVETRDTGTNSLSPDVILPRQWLTSDIRWLSDSNVQFNNDSYLTTHKDSATIPSGPLQVRIIAASGDSGPGTWYSAALRSISAWGQAGRALRMNSYHDFIPYDGATPVEIQVDWILVRECAQVEPAATVVNEDLVITSPKTKNYAGPMKGHYPASYGFESDPSFPYSGITEQGQPILTGQPPEGWIPHYCGQVGALRVIDEYMGHKKVVELRKNTGTYGESYTGMVNNFPTSVTAGTIEFWLSKNTDAGMDASKITILGTGGSIQFGIEDEALYRGAYASKTNISENVFPKDTWKHIRVDFDISQSGWQIHLDGVLYGSGYAFAFEGTPTDFTGIDLRTHSKWEFPSSADPYNFYLDAVGYSWDPGYSIGDNLNEGILLDFEPIVRSRTDWEGYYPSFEGYDDIPEGGQPDNWGYWQGGSTGSSDSIPAPELYVLDSITDGNGNTHNRVLYCKDNSGGTIFNGDGFWDKPQSSGTVEFWVLNHDPSSNFGVSFGLLAENQTYYGTAVVAQEGNTLRIMNGSSGWYNTGISFVDDKWYRISMDFSGDGTYAGLTANHFRTRFYDSDGTTLLYSSSDVMYQRNGSSVAFHAGTGDSSTANLYFDAIGYSWNPNYEIDDNSRMAVYEGPERADISWIGYSLDGQPNVTISGATTLVMPLAGEHTIQLFIEDSYGNWYSSTESFLTEQISLVTPESINYAKGMNGYYPGTYGFENEPYNSVGLDIDFLDEYYTSHPAPSSYVVFVTRNSRTPNDHNNVLNIIDAQGGGWCWGVHNFDSPPTAGTVEFYLQVTGTVGTHYFELRAANDLPAIEMRATFSGSKLQYFDGSVWQDIGDLVIDQWFHHSITFDCEAGVNGQFSWIITYENGTEFDRVDNIEFQNDLNTLDELYIGSTVADYQISTWWDAFGFSWDPNYTIGDNMKEGLLISFDTPTQFDWTGYSLDGGANVTIWGNTTIPLPSAGTHTIQLYGSDSASNPYKSVLREFQVRTINVDSPKNMVYSTPMSGHYPATYSFENEKTGEANPYGFVNTDAESCSSSVVEELDGHKNIIQQFDDSPGLGAVLTNYFDTPQLFGTVEFYQRATSFRTDDRPSIIVFLKSVTGSEIVFATGQYVGGTNNFAYDNGSGWPNIRGDANVDQWYHISISWRCTGAPIYQNLAEGSWKVFIDGMEYGIYDLLRDEAFVSLVLSTAGVPSNYYSYWDAVGLSWDPGYTTGDNLNEGLLLGYTYDALKEGHYPGTYSFATDLNGQLPSEWTDWIIDPVLQQVSVEESYKGHDKVLRIYDNTAAMETDAFNYFEPQAYGTIEYWWLASDITNKVFSLTLSSQGGPWGLLVGIRNDFIYYYDGTDHNIAPASSDEWYHIRVDFRCTGAAPYYGLNENRFFVYVNGVRYGEYNFANSYTHMDRTAFGVGTASTMTAYVDAVGYSWDPDYKLWDNFHEGSVNSVGTATPLEWIGYSLDGQANVTIDGNHTIPMLTPGMHTIQVVGFDYLGNYYQSDVRSFQMWEAIPPEPPTISGPNDFSFDFGDVGYSILWSATDPNPSNYTVYQNGSVYQEGTWITTIIASLDDLEEGLHNFTCLIENLYGLRSSDEVWVTVNPAAPDTTSPTITSPADFIFEEGSIGYAIIWSGSDDRTPWWASVWRNTTLIYSQAWIGNNIVINLDGLAANIYYYNCTLTDEAGNSIYDIVRVAVTPAVPDIDNPVIIPPPTLIYEEGTEGNILFWECSDAHPYAYKITRETTELLYTPWHGENITFNVDYLSIGTWIFNLTLWDLSGNTVSSQVTVVVTPPVPDTTLPAISIPIEQTIAENMRGSIIWEVFDEHPSVFVIYRNGSVVYAESQWYSGIIQYSFASLPLGNWVFTLTLWDEAGNSASQDAIVHVLTGSAYDTSSPEISHPPNLEIEYGTLNNSVTIYLFDEHPQEYSIFLDMVKISEVDWITQNIQVTVSVDGLSIGLHLLNITAIDVYGNEAFREILIDVGGDINPPILTPLPDIVLRKQGSHTVSWQVIEDNPDHFVIKDLSNNSIIFNGTWTGSEIKYDLGRFSRGTYDLRCIAYDSYGNYAYDDFVLTVKGGGDAPGFEILPSLSVLFIFVIMLKVISKRRIKR